MVVKITNHDEIQVSFFPAGNTIGRTRAAAVVGFKEPIPVLSSDLKLTIYTGGASEKPNKPQTSSHARPTLSAHPRHSKEKKRPTTEADKSSVTAEDVTMEPRSCLLWPVTVAQRGL